MVKIDGYPRPSNNYEAMKFLFAHKVTLETGRCEAGFLHLIIHCGEMFVDTKISDEDRTIGELFDAFLCPAACALYKSIYELCPHGSDPKACEDCRGVSGTTEGRSENPG